MSVRVELNSGANLLNGTNGAARVLLYDASGNPAVLADGGAVASSQPGIVIGGADHDSFRVMQLSREGGLEPGLRRVLLNETCEGATLNGQRWTTTVAGAMAAAQAATQITLNSGAITTINTGVLLTSRNGIYKHAEGVLHCAIRMRSTAVANQSAEWGLGQQGTLSATAAIIDNGAFWRFTTSGTVVPVIAFNGTDAVQGTDIAGSLSSSNYYNWHIVVEDDRVIYICERADTGATISRQVLRIGLTGQRLWSVTHVNALLRIRNSGSAPASAGQLLVSDVSIYQKGIQHAVPMHLQLADNTLAATVNPTAITQSQQFANSAAPANATLSNTTPSYTTLGGLYSVAAAASAATDNVLFGYTVPSPYTMKVFGVHISMWNTGAANAATPATTFMWGVGMNGASGNLATGGHIRMALGDTNVAINAAIGAAGTDCIRTFSVPLICSAGLNFAIIMRIVGGAATASQVLQGHVVVDAVFE